ncbi:MAG: NDP-sugar synthase [Euryarchaeota archaeon]|nr:NDP-sugar synthase [Euryarchaeota archaeon]
MLEPLAKQGCREFIIASKGYDSTAQLNKYFKEGEGFFARHGIQTDREFMYQPNYNDRGSGDAVAYCAEYYDLKKDFIVMGGDNIFDLELEKVMEFHRSTGAYLTVLLKEIPPGEDISQLGVADVDGDMRLEGFVEKPAPGREPSRLVNAGVYIFSPRVREVFEMMGSRNRDLGGDVVPFLIEHGYPVYGYILEGYWADIGTPASFLRTTLDVLHGRISNISLQHRTGDAQWVHPTTMERNPHLREQIGSTVLMGRHCTVGRDLEIENSAVGHFCMIGDGVKIRNSVILSFVNIGDNCTLQNCILGRFTTVMAGSTISADLPVDVGSNKDLTPVVGGGGVTIFENSVIGPGVRVAPISQSHQILQTGRFHELGMDRENVYFMEK